MHLILPSGRGLLSRMAGLLLAAMLLAGCQSNPTLTSEGLLPPTRPVDALAFANVERRGHSALVIDFVTGQTLYADKADELRYPASLTKMMTLYMLFEAVDSGRLRADSQLLVSANAAAKPPSKLGIAAGETIGVPLAAQALSTRSANDVATVIAENLAGTEAAFAAQMTAKARQLGMNNTRFANASGLPDRAQISTARDMALLARALRTRFPQHAGLYRVESYEYRGRTYRATNRLLGKVNGVDGMKTGYINDAGSHLVATVNRPNRRLIVVVMGGQSASARDAEVTELIERYAGAGS